MGPSPDPEHYVGYYDGSKNLELFPAEELDWVEYTTFYTE